MGKRRFQARLSILIEGNEVLQRNEWSSVLVATPWNLCVFEKKGATLGDTGPFRSKLLKLFAKRSAKRHIFVSSPLFADRSRSCSKTSFFLTQEGAKNVFTLLRCREYRTNRLHRDYKFCNAIYFTDNRQWIIRDIFGSGRLIGSDFGFRYREKL